MIKDFGVDRMPLRLSFSFRASPGIDPYYPEKNGC
jgi:hypothetical protein